jgi:quinol-cytochrome oxidoreductase complex cytochrome b subunit
MTMIRRALTSLRDTVRGVWEDIKSSTDASLLGAARFLGLLYGPIDRRLQIDEAFRKALQYRLPSHVGWRHALGGITYLLFLILVVTGVMLAIFYRPSVEEAYPSVQHIVSSRPFGWLVRDVHHWSANLIVLALLAHMARVFFEAAYKPPRETNWLIGLLLLAVVLAFGATGYLLPWDQWSYWTVTEVMNATAQFPIVGRALADRLMGDVIVSGATLSRFFALHVIVLPWVAFVLLGYHFTLVRRRGIAPPVSDAQEKPRWRKSGLYRPEDEEEEGVPFFPNQLLRSFTVGTLTFAVVITLAVLYPRVFPPPADPAAVPDRLVSTWVPIDVSMALIRFSGPWGLMLFWVLGFSLVLIPLIDRGPDRRLRQRPLAAALGIAFFAGYALLLISGRVLGSFEPSAEIGSRQEEMGAVPARAPIEIPSLDPDGGTPVSEEGAEQ